MTRPLTLAVLAGGRGARLGGQLKPLATRDGEALASRLLRVLGPEAEAAFLVAPASMHRELADVAPLIDDPGEGPGPAAYAAAQAARTPWLLLAAGDHVAPAVSLLDRLWAAREGAEAVVVEADGRRQGGFALLRVDAVRALDPPGPRSLWRLFEGLRTVYLPIDDLEPEERAALEDVDTPADVDRFGVRLPGAG